jgi:DNA-binding MarR family transcriptional regulator
MSQHHQDESLVDAWLDIVGTYKTVHALLNQELTKSGFTFSQYRVIRSLGKYGDMPMNRLGEHMLVTPANITGIVDRLEQKGYVERKETGEDRRICTMRLTRKGQTSYQQTSAHHKRIISQIMRTFTKQEIMRLTKLLQRIKEMALKERIRLRNEGTQ